MKIFRKIGDKIVPINTDAYKKVEQNTESKKVRPEEAMVLSKNTDPAFGKLDYYLKPKKKDVGDEEKINNLRKEIKKFFKY